MVSNGQNTVQITYYQNGLYTWSDRQLFRLSDYIALTNNMQIHFVFHNSHPLNFQEAAVDKIWIDDYLSITNVENHSNLIENSVSLQAYPIPFGDKTLVNYNIPPKLAQSKLYLNVYNFYGQLLKSYPIDPQLKQMTIGEQLPSGTYILQLANKSLKIIKY